MNSFEEAWQYLLQQLPMYQRVGNAAFKKSLDNIVALCDALGNPQETYPTIHLAGTNGKGSSAHWLAAIFQSAGYRTGLYTSPHLKRFTERIRVNGEEMSESAVLEFVKSYKALIERIQPSFFEITVAMAFQHFAHERVDIAVIETGLGGRLDSTNVLKKPLCCLITNIGYDHMEMLGDTLPKIALEKAGIIKPKVPIVISEKQPEVADVFRQKAAQEQAPLFFATDSLHIEVQDEGKIAVWQNSSLWLEGVSMGLLGEHQYRNVAGVLQVISVIKNTGFSITENSIKNGIEKVVSLTGLKGRWQRLGQHPLAYCDVGHNEDGIRQVLRQLEHYSYHQLWMVWGMVADKAHEKILAMLPKEANFIFCCPDVPRGYDAQALANKAEVLGIKGKVIPNVLEAYQYALAHANPNDFIFAGGSTFVVAELPI